MNDIRYANNVKLYVKQIKHETNTFTSEWYSDVVKRNLDTELDSRIR